jgi:hypothetical protein
MGRLRYALLSFLALACIGTYLACSGGHHSTPGRVEVPPAVTTVSNLITASTNETDEPKDLDALNLAGFDTEDEHAFDSLFPAN